MTTFPSLFEHARASRDDQVWRRFVRAFGPYVQRCLARRLRDFGQPALAHELEDLEQEVYLRLLTLAAPCGQADPMTEPQVRAYVIRIATSVVIDRGRHAVAGKRRCTSMRTLGSLAMDVFESRTPTPEERVLVREHLERIVAGCRRVAGRSGQRAKLRALSLVLFAGWQSRDAAQTLGGQVSASNIDVLVSRARRHLAREGIVLPRRRGEPAAAPGADRVPELDRVAA
jgi:DNA-directed RNA polymerase specialized sigma24 family protein